MMSHDVKGCRRGSELMNTSAAEEEIALLREEVAELHSREHAAEAAAAEAELQLGLDTFKAFKDL